MNATATPHDAFFKKHLTYLPTARKFLETYLPEKIRSHCNLKSLQVVPTSFIENDLSAFYSDVLLSMETDCGQGFVYSLIEHQSTPDKHMAFRMMRYAIATMQRHLDEGHAELPLVVPFLFYHGKSSPYPHSMNWLDALHNPTLAKEVFSRPFPLIDITVVSDEEILTHESLALLEFLQKHVRRKDLQEILDPLATLFALKYNTDEQMAAAVRYILQTGETASRDKFIEALTQGNPQLREHIMTIEQEWRQESRQSGMQEGFEKGIEEGIEKGIEKGIEQGIKEEKLRMARRLLAMKLDRATILQASGLTERELQQLNA